MRLIDADALERIILSEGSYQNMVGVLEEEIDNAPTIDAEPVVRCKDCKYWQDNNGGYPHEECRWGKEETPDETDFCSYGERREP